MGADGKAAKFKALAEKRVSMAIKGIRRIGRLSRRGSYEYSPVQIDKMFSALRHEIDTVEREFRHEERLLFRLD